MDCITGIIFDFIATHTNMFYILKVDRVSGRRPDEQKRSKTPEKL